MNRDEPGWDEMRTNRVPLPSGVALLMRSYNVAARHGTRPTAGLRISVSSPFARPGPTDLPAEQARRVL